MTEETFLDEDMDDAILEDLDDEEFEELEDYVLEDEDIDDGMGDTPCDCDGQDCDCI
jgi:hypothetical protein